MMGIELSEWGIVNGYGYETHVRKIFLCAYRAGSSVAEMWMTLPFLFHSLVIQSLFTPFSRYFSVTC